MAIPAPPRTEDKREREEWYLEVYNYTVAADSKVTSMTTNISTASTNLSVATSKIDSAHP